MVPDGILDQIGRALGAKHFHHPVLVIGHSPGRHVQDAANFLHYLPLGQQLQDFTLPSSHLRIFEVDQRGPQV
jgi:hypothetical protein